MDFFNDLGKLFSHAAKSVTGRVREEAADSRADAELRTAQDELDRHFAELGRAYFESLEDPSAAVPEELIERVRGTLGRIQQMLTRQTRAQQVRCPGCGSLQQEGANFCSNCGKRMPDPQPVASDPGDDREYCAKCGAMRHGAADYCEVCGHAFDGGENLPVPAAIKQLKSNSEPLEEPEEYNLQD